MAILFLFLSIYVAEPTVHDRLLKQRSGYALINYIWAGEYELQHWFSPINVDEHISLWSPSSTNGNASAFSVMMKSWTIQLHNASNLILNVYSLFFGSVCAYFQGFTHTSFLTTDHRENL